MVNTSVMRLDARPLSVSKSFTGLFGKGRADRTGRLDEEGNQRPDEDLCPKARSEVFHTKEIP